MKSARIFGNENFREKPLSAEKPEGGPFTLLKHIALTEMEDGALWWKPEISGKISHSAKKS